MFGFDVLDDRAIGAGDHQGDAVLAAQIGIQVPRRNLGRVGNDLHLHELPLQGQR